MSAESASAIVVTPELQDVMREYTKAVMRDKPENVLEYSQHWFVTKYTDRRMGVQRTATPNTLGRLILCWRRCRPRVAAGRGSRLTLG